MNLRCVVTFLTILTCAVTPSVTRGTTFSDYIDKENLARLESMTVTYLTARDGKTSCDTLKYSFQDGINVDMSQSGTLSTGRYSVAIDRQFCPVSVEYKYNCETEKLDFHEKYQFKDDCIVYIDKKNSKVEKLPVKPMTADTITQMEYLVFMDPAKLNNIKFNSIIIPNGVKVPITFKHLRDETLTVQGRPVACTLYESEIDGLMGVAVKLFYGKARLWIMKEFPHIRVKMDFFDKIITLQDYKVVYKNGAGTS